MVSVPQGGIEVSTTKEGGQSFTITGKIEQTSDTVLQITELPIRKWTQDYKEFLESQMVATEKQREPLIRVSTPTTQGMSWFRVTAPCCDIIYSSPLYPVQVGDDCARVPSISSYHPIGLQDIKEYHTDTSVHFEVHLTPENMAVAVAEGLAKKFKLSTSLSTSNMHLFDMEGRMTKYDTPEQSTPPLHLL